MLSNIPQSQDEFLDISFKDLDYSESEVIGKSFTSCKFLKCNFFKTEFKECVFNNCTFEKCDMSVIKITATQIKDLVFEKCKVVGVDWTEKYRYKVQLEFYESLLNYSNFSNIELKNFVLEDSTALEVDFIDTSMIKANCKGTDFTGSIFLRTNLNEADFRAAKHYLINIQNNKVKKAKFSLPEALNLLAPFEIVLGE
jgi:fluoroquinolone resistance protein